jgi:mannitol/fructose-specific phosphotransferase system IIA component (Ntr-type)
MADPDVETRDQSADAGAIRQFSLTELLPRERIRLDVRADDWQDAIRETGKLLFNTGAVRFEYIEAMIKVAQELGPYIVIAPGIALPHAATNAGAKQSALSLIKLAEPVFFGNPDNDPVRLVFGLAAIDNKAHVMALQAMAELFSSKELMEQLFHADTVDAVMNLMQRAEQMLQKK